MKFPELPPGHMRHVTWEVFSAFVSMESQNTAAGKPNGGMSARDVWLTFGTGTLSYFYAHALEVAKMGLLTMVGKNKARLKRYYLAESWREAVAAITVIPKYKLLEKRRPYKRKPKPLIPQAKKVKQATPPSSGFPDLVRGLPYVPNAELRTHLGKVIEALESMQEHLAPVLALLLDLDRDFDRYSMVRGHLVGMKKMLDEVKL